MRYNLAYERLKMCIMFYFYNLVYDYGAKRFLCGNVNGFDFSMKIAHIPVRTEIKGWFRILITGLDRRSAPKGIPHLASIVKSP